MHTSMNKAKFEVDKDKCTACGLCVKVCPGAVLSLEDSAPRIADFDAFGWNGCWECQHCLAVCPAGAISILGKRPEDSLPPPVDAGALDALIAAAYFELLCASRGLGAVIMTFPLDALENMPEVKALLEIPENHYAGVIIGFGHPEIRYARGAQRTLDASRIHRPEIQEV